MPSLLARILLFLSSYFPLAVICGFLFWNDHQYIAILIVLTGFVGLAGMFMFLSAAQKLAATRVKFREVQKRDSEALNYIVAYVIPFLAIGQPGQSVPLLIFLAVLGVLYVKLNMVHINPALNLFGYYLYEITTEDGTEFPIITRKRIRPNETMSVVKLGNEVLFEKTNAE